MGIVPRKGLILSHQQPEHNPLPPVYRREDTKQHKTPPNTTEVEIHADGFADVSDDRGSARAHHVAVGRKGEMMIPTRIIKSSNHHFTNVCICPASWEKAPRTERPSHVPSDTALSDNNITNDGHLGRRGIPDKCHVSMDREKTQAQTVVTCRPAGQAGEESSAGQSLTVPPGTVYHNNPETVRHRCSSEDQPGLAVLRYESCAVRQPPAGGPRTGIWQRWVSSVLQDGVVERARRRT